MGQYTNLANPLQYLTMVGAIANGGVPVYPYFIESITTPPACPPICGWSKPAPVC